MEDSTFRDITFECCDCGSTFVWSAAEQEFYLSKSLSPPRRCKPCRTERRARLVPDPSARRQWR